MVTEPTELAFGVEDVDPAELGRRFQQEAAVEAMRYVGDTLNQDMARSGPDGAAAG